MTNIQKETNKQLAKSSLTCHFSTRWQNTWQNRPQLIQNDKTLDKTTSFLTEVTKNWKGSIEKKLSVNYVKSQCHKPDQNQIIARKIQILHWSRWNRFFILFLSTICLSKWCYDKVFRFPTLICVSIKNDQIQKRKKKLSLHL